MSDEPVNEKGHRRISVLIVDDHPIVRQGLRTLLELQEGISFAGEAVNGLEAIDKVRILKPDVVLMDLMMPEMDGISATAKIKEFQPETKVIALTSFVEDDKVIPAIQAGAVSFLLKDVSPIELIEAIRAADSGETRLHPHVVRKLMSEVTQKSQGKLVNEPNLTAREMDVLALVANGMSNKEIAQKLVLSEKTVKTHISNLLSKLALEDRTRLAIHAIKTGLVKID